MSALEADFNAAAAKVKAFTTKPTNDELLQVYGLFKQGTVGDNTTSQPWAVQLEARAKWDAWASHKGMAKEEAQRLYIEKANQLATKYA